MTYLEKYMQEHPEDKRSPGIIADMLCPTIKMGNTCNKSESCWTCWNQEIPEDKPLVYAHLGPDFATVTDVKEGDGGFTVTVEPIIKDSGDRTEFATGAVRDMREGKGRCDLMPLDVVGAYLEDSVIMDIAHYQSTCDVEYLVNALRDFRFKPYPEAYTMFLEVAKHFEEGAKKYGENNWQKGIPTWCYIDSAVRHYLKWLRGDKDEPHDRAFVWNLLCCIWTIEHEEELKECHNG